MIPDLQDRIRDAAEYLENRLSPKADVAIILGTGLSSLTSQFDLVEEVPYADIPYFSITTLDNHDGKLIYGRMEGVQVIALAGRFHYYEGYSAVEIAFPVWVLADLGIRTLILSNASGATSAQFETGDLVFISDHINLHPDNPLRGLNNDTLGPRYPDMSEAYSKKLLSMGKSACDSLSIPFKQGVYFGWQGPNLETPAEYAFIHRMGGDMVGMSTIHEVIAAVHRGIDVLAISVITNVCYPKERITKTTLEQVLEVVEKTTPKAINLVREVLRRIKASQIKD